MLRSTALFCVAGVSTYEHMQPLTKVPQELRTMRRALSSLGMSELFAPAPGEPELSPQGLRMALQDWMPDANSRDLTVVVYCTGHGFLDLTSHKWRLAERDASEQNPRLSVSPDELLTALNRPGVVGRIMLLLDACYAGEGAREAFSAVSRAFREAGGAADLCVMSAVSRSPAEQYVFAPAFAKALHGAAATAWDQPFLKLDDIEASLAQALPDPDRRPQTVLGRAVGSQVLPNPFSMPSNLPPGWLAAHGRWSAPARGVSSARRAGWFFTGRERALNQLWQYICAERGSGLRYLAGPSGSGRTAILARMLTTATAQDRALLPVVARGGVMPPHDIRLAAVDASGSSLAQLQDNVARRLAPTSAEAGSLPTAILLDNMSRAQDPLAVCNWARDEAGAPVIGVLDGCPGSILDVAAPVTDLSDESHDPLADIRRYLELRTAVSDRAGDMDALDALEAAADGCFAAAVSAADAWAAGEGSVAAEAAARERLAGARADTLAAVGLDRELAVVAMDVLAEVSAWEADAGLPPDVWALVTGELTGSDCPAEHLLASAGLLGLQSVGTASAAFRVAARTVELARPDVAAALVRTVHDRTRDGWKHLEPPVLSALVGAAALGSPAASPLLCDSSFLLACPPAAVSRALRPPRPAPAALSLAWGQVPALAPPDDRGLALQLAAARHRCVGLYATRGTPDWLTVLSATSYQRCAERADIVGATAVSGARLDDILVATAHDDGRLRLWGGSGLDELAECAPPFPGEAVGGLAAASIQGEIVVLCTNRDGQLARWSALRGSSAEFLALSARTATSLGSLGFLLVQQQGACVVDGQGAVLSAFPLDGEGARVVAAPDGDEAVVWTAATGGRLRCRRVEMDGNVLAATSVVLAGLELVQAATDGSVVAVHRSGVSVVSPEGSVTWPRFSGMPAFVQAAVPAAHGALLGGVTGGSTVLAITATRDGGPRTLSWHHDLVTALAVGAGESVLVGRRTLAVFNTW